MKIVHYLIICAAALAAAPAVYADGPNIRPTDISLMHESRATPFPADGETVTDRAVSFQWPLPGYANTRGAVLDGMDAPKKKFDKSTLKYKIRFSTDAKFSAKKTTTAETEWPFYNPEKPLAPGKWYWQYAYTDAAGKDDWSPVYTVTVGKNDKKFAPPSFNQFIRGLNADHPRILVTNDTWDALLKNSQDKPERQWYIEAADKALAKPMKSVSDIRTDALKNMKNDMQRNAYLTRESRRIIDAEESACNALFRAYILTRDRKYADEAIKRVLTMNSWDANENVKGDFNDATILSLASIAYDTFYNILIPEQRSELLAAVKRKGLRFYNHDNNYLENHIAENHIWQMTMRISAMAALATYGDLPESEKWARYYYNVWLCRFPGLNEDGAWHNGDSYFTVNTRTLVEVPWLYSRISGFNFFADPWYENNTLYTIYQQPPFSKSGGNGSSHQNVTKPNSVRIGYLDAMARLLGNTYAADYVRRTLKAQPNYLKKAIGAKPGDLGWFRIQCDKPLPEGPGLPDLPHGHVFPQSGLASWCTNWDRVGGNAMWSFRSSPYGSTSHALANQNAFNTFFGGQSLFYSAGHHTSFVDKHALICHRGTFGHNTILPNGNIQKIGVEGYGWIPRSYMSDKVGYVVGDASNAYGEVVSHLWLERGEAAEVEFSKENGWDKNHVKTFRRHIVTLGNTGYIFIYDELEADEPIHWDYTLHTVTNPMTFDTSGKDFVHVTATNKVGASDAYIYSSGALQCDTTSQFKVPAVNWLKGDANGKFKPNPNHWHFTAKSQDAKVYRFGTIVNTHAHKHPAVAPFYEGKGVIKAGRWRIKANFSQDGKPQFKVYNPGDGTSVTYEGGETIIEDGGKTTTLVDELPKLEI